MVRGSKRILNNVVKEGLTEEVIKIWKGMEGGEEVSQERGYQAKGS